MAVALFSDTRTGTISTLVVTAALLGALATAVVEGAETATPQPRKQASASKKTASANQAKAREETIPALDEMITTALKSHPEVSAAQAKVQAALAELDLVRLEVAQGIAEFHKSWGVLEGRFKEAEANLRELKAINRAGRGAVIPSEQMAAAEARVETVRIELAGMRSQLPLILGRTAMEPQRPTGLVDERQHAESALLHAEQALKLTQKDLEAGRGDQDDVCLWSKRVMEAEGMLDRKPIAAIERHRDRMQALLKVAMVKFRAAVLSETSVVSLQYYVAEAELLLAQSK